MCHALVLGATILSATAPVPPVDFARDIRPILFEQCARCHASGKARGGFALDTREALLAHESAVVPGSAERSRLVQLVRGDDPDLRMPLEGEPLAAPQIDLLARWIDEGAIWPPEVPLHGNSGRSILPRRPELPPPDDDARANPIDRILDRYWSQRGVTPAPLVDDATFLRRAWLDLTGLLPPRESVDAFLVDSSPDKRAALVETLLADRTACAEHWLSFWNDLLRNDYTGPGYIDGGRTQITPWLYESLRDRTPYDRFAAELINPTPATAGFANGIVWRGETSSAEGREIQFARNVAQVFLGVNLKCASCHDSFVDDWRLADAYGMAAVMAEQPLELFRCGKPTGEWAVPAFIFPEVGAIDASLPPARRLEQLAALVTSPRNGRFTRTIVNRIWARLMGRGLIEPTDSMDGDPWCPDLLDHLAVELADERHDLTRLIARIATSSAYQRRSVPDDGRGSFLFRGPVARRLSAEQFVDAVWSLTQAAPSSADAPLPGPPRHGRWVWSHADASHGRPAGERILLRHLFDLPSIPTSAIAVLTCDNAYELLVNDRALAADAEWPTVEAVDLTSALRAGANQILITATNLGEQPNPAGLFFEALLRWGSSPDQVIGSGPDWEWTDPASGAGGPWRPAAVNQVQGFLGPDVERRIDAALAVAGRASPVRASLVRASLVRASLVRASLVSADPLMRTLGRPDREQVVSQRPRDLTTLQALHLSNGQDVADLLRRGSARLEAEALSADRPAESPAEYIVQRLYLHLLSRRPSGAEQRVALELLAAQPGAAGIEDLMWILLMLPEFQLVA